MRKWIIAFSLLAALLGLAACGGPKAEVGLAEQPYLFNWFDNSIVVNANGERILGPGRDGEYTIWEDCYGQQRYILAQESVLAEYELGFCGRPWLISEKITVYDLQGRLLKNLQVEDGKTYWTIYPDGDLQKSLLLLDRAIGEQPQYQVFDFDGNLLLEKPLPQAIGASDSESNLCLAEDFFAVVVHLYYDDKPAETVLDVYNWEGQPVAWGQDYVYISYVDYVDGMGSADNPYYNAVRQDAQGNEEHLILDGQGQALLSSPDEFFYLGDDLFFVRLNEHFGIVNKQGQWLYPQKKQPHIQQAEADKSKIYTIYGSGIVINGAGELVLDLQDEVYDYYILTNTQKEPQGIFVCKNFFDESRVNEYGTAYHVENQYYFYDLNGVLQHQLTLPVQGYLADNNYFQAALDGDWRHSLFFVSNLQSAGSYQVLDINGRLLLEKQLCNPAEQGDCYAYMRLTDKYIIVTYVLYAKEPDETGWYPFVQQTDLYRLDGQPVELPKPYNDVGEIVDTESGEIIGYWGNLSSGEEDLLDRNLQVLFSGRYVSNEVIQGLLQAEQDGQRGLIDMQGNWIYREPLPEED